MENIRHLIRDFETTHTVKYLSDLEGFINESNFEDFYSDNDAETIYVSTIHKSKGREFDNVYMMLKDSFGTTDEERRKLYVGMTRAKNNLYIHTNTDLFGKYNIEKVVHDLDEKIYDEPSEIVLQTTHKDVVLDYFKNKKELIFELRSGFALSVDDVYLSAEFNGRNVRVAKFSKAFIEKLEKLQEKGYYAMRGEVQFIVAWKGEDDEKETPIILSNLYFTKK
jgi:ATP-dependent DNA helicase RecQ